MVRKTPIALLAGAGLLVLGGCSAAPSAKDAPSDQERAENALRRGEVGEVISLLRGRTEGSARGAKTLGRAYLALGESDHARDEFARSVGLDRGDPEAWDLLGQACEAGRFFDRAIEAYERSLAIRRADAAVARRLAYLLADLGRHREAVDALRATAALAPDDLELRYRLGVEEMAREHFEEAEAALDLVLERAGPQPAALLARGLSRARRAEREAAASRPALYDAAEKDLLEAARLSPDDAIPLFDLGWAREQRRDFEGAEKAYLEALARNPQHVSTILRLAGLHEERSSRWERMARLNATSPEPPAVAALSAILEAGAALDLYRRARALTNDPLTRRPLDDRIAELSRIAGRGR